MPRSIFDIVGETLFLFFYAFSPTHIKDVCVSMITTYESKLSISMNFERKLFQFDLFVLIQNEAPKIVTIKSYPIALTCRFIQSLIFAYAFGYIMWYKHGYQDRDPTIISSVTLEVQGIRLSGGSPSVVIDRADYVIPSQENNAIFLMTNYIRTDQKLTLCAEGSDVMDARCKNNSQCRVERKYPFKLNGRWTGNCRFPEGRCEMEGWCPVENDTSVPEPVKDALNYTLVVHNFVEFARFKISRRNVLNNSVYFRQCRHNAQSDPLCPLFRIDDILNSVEENPDERNKMLKHGAVIRIKIDWMCNLDFGEDACLPSYSFGRLDSNSTNEHFSLGFNFRYASHWKFSKQSYRTLTKAFGLRFIVTVNGEAGRFDLFVLTLNIGSMIGVLGLATVICDILVLHFSKKSQLYRKQKFQTLPSVESVAILSRNSTWKSNFQPKNERKRSFAENGKSTLAKF